MGFRVNCDWCHKFIKEVDSANVSKVAPPGEDVLCKECQAKRDKLKGIVLKLPAKFEFVMKKHVLEAERMLKDELRKLSKGGEPIHAS